MADASPFLLSIHDSIVQGPDVTPNQSELSSSLSVFPSHGVATSNTSPSVPSLTLSRSQSHSTAAYASPEGFEEHDNGLAEPAPVVVEFKCPHCPEKRSNRTLLNKHINTHTQPYRCSHPACGVGKATQRDLDRHQDTHGKIRRYFCPVAGCAYDVRGIHGGFSRRLDNAKRHLRTTHDNSQGMSVLREDSQGRLWSVQDMLEVKELMEDHSFWSALAPFGSIVMCNIDLGAIKSCTYYINELELVARRFHRSQSYISNKVRIYGRYIGPMGLDFRVRIWEAAIQGVCFASSSPKQQTLYAALGDLKHREDVSCA